MRHDWPHDDAYKQHSLRWRFSCVSLNISFGLIIIIIIIIILIIIIIIINAIAHDGVKLRYSERCRCTLHWIM